MTVTLITPNTQHQQLRIPMFAEAVSAGFPSPAQDYVEQELDLNQLCIKHPCATYFVRVQGDSMQDAGIHPGDILVVDRSLQPVHGQIVIAAFHGELTVKRLELVPRVRLVPCNRNYPPLEIPADSELEVMGVVTHAIRNILAGHKA